MSSAPFQSSMSTMIRTGPNGQPEMTDQMRAELRRMIAKGSDIELADGTNVTVVFTARMMGAVEAEYGSIQAYLEALRQGNGGKIYTLLAWTFSKVCKVSQDQAWDLIDSKRLGEYMEALTTALVESMPEFEEIRGNVMAGTDPATSPGPDSSTSPSPSSTSSPRPSGG